MKKITISFNATHEIGQQVYFMSYKGLPRKGVITGYIIDTVDDFTQYYIRLDNNCLVSHPLSENEFFDTYEAMLKKRKLIAPAEARRLLEKHRKEKIWFIYPEDVELLEQRILLCKPKK